MRRDDRRTNVEIFREMLGNLAAPPGPLLDPYPDAAPQLTVAQLLALDRRLTPEEQARIDAAQEAAANAMQAAEEKAVYTDPRTGQKRIAKVDYSTAPPAPKPPAFAAPPPSGTWAWWEIGIAAVAVLGGGFAAYRVATWWRR